MQHSVSIRVNGIVETHVVPANQTLLAFLRETLNLTGAKEGCSEGECGACMVLLDGKAVNACLVLAVELDGHEVQTVEALGDAHQLHPLQAAFLAHHAVQCGYCTPGMLLTAAAFLRERPQATEEEIREALSGNLCRCTGYRQILDAVESAAAEMRASRETQRLGRTP
jgi:aerobic carbon-monoxide dehydrogenase small subunit